MKIDCIATNVIDYLIHYELILYTVHVGGSSKIQTLCHMTQVVLKLMFTVMKRLTDY